jgi:hypothetical protein
MYNTICIRSIIVLTVFMAICLSAQAVPAQYGNQHRPSPSDCDAYARNYAQNYSGGVLRGAVRGGGRGALFGAIVGGGKGARRGAALGGVVGGTRNAVNREQIRSRAYNDCMSGRVRW